MVWLGLFVFHDEGFVDADAFAATGFFDFHPVAVDGVDEVAAVGAAVLDGVDGGGKLFDYVAQPSGSAVAWMACCTAGMSLVKEGLVALDGPPSALAD